MYKALHLSPMIPSYDLKKTAAFFQEFLDFELLMSDETYYILSKDDLTIHLLRAGKDIGEMEFYMEVDDLDSIWEKLKVKQKVIKMKAPFDQEYGMREIHVIIPFTITLLFIGKVIQK